MDSGYDDLIVTTVFRFAFPFVLVFGLYVIFHGHSSPGGGFQGGVILGAALILRGIVLGRQDLMRFLPRRALLALCGIGVMIYAAAGWAALAFGGSYLDYGAIPLLHPPQVRALMILAVEIGVGITVMAVMTAIYLALGGER